MVVGCTGMLAYLSPELAVVSVTVFPPVAGIGVWFGRRMKKQQKGVQAALAASSAVAEEVGESTYPGKKKAMTQSRVYPESERVQPSKGGSWHGAVRPSRERYTFARPPYLVRKTI